MIRSALTRLHASKCKKFPPSPLRISLLFGTAFVRDSFICGGDESETPAVVLIQFPLSFLSFFHLRRGKEEEKCRNSFSSSSLLGAKIIALLLPPPPFGPPCLLQYFFLSFPPRIIRGNSCMCHRPFLSLPRMGREPSSLPLISYVERDESPRGWHPPSPFFFFFFLSSSPAVIILPFLHPGPKIGTKSTYYLCRRYAKKNNLRTRESVAIKKRRREWKKTGSKREAIAEIEKEFPILPPSWKLLYFPLLSPFICFPLSGTVTLSAKVGEKGEIDSGTTS